MIKWRRATFSDLSLTQVQKEMAEVCFLRRQRRIVGHIGIRNKNLDRTIATDIRTTTTKKKKLSFSLRISKSKTVAHNLWQRMIPQSYCFVCCKFFFCVVNCGFARLQNEMLCLCSQHLTWIWNLQVMFSDCTVYLSDSDKKRLSQNLQLRISQKIPAINWALDYHLFLCSGLSRLFVCVCVCVCVCV